MEPLTVISTVAAVVSAAMAVADYLRGPDRSNADVLAAIAQLSRQIEAAKSEIIEAIANLEDHELEGLVVGYIMALQEYDAHAGERGYLDHIVIDGLDTFGRLVVLSAAIDPLSDRHNKVLDILLTLIFVRAIAMYERERRHHASDIKDIPLMYPPAVQQLIRALQALKVRSDRRVIGPHTERMADSITVGYYVDSTGTSEEPPAFGLIW